MSFSTFELIQHREEGVFTDPLAKICAGENLKMALSVNGFLTTDILLDILELQYQTSRSSPFSDQLLQLQYADFQKLFPPDRTVYNDEQEIFRWMCPRTFDRLRFTEFTFSHEDKQCVNESSYPAETFASLKECASYKLWDHLETDEAKERVHLFFTSQNADNRAQMRSLNQALNYLHRGPLLTERNITHLISPENSAFLTGISELNLTRIPQHMRTQESLDEMLRLSRGADPTVTINRYIARLIGGGRPGDTQSTHRQSVHDSVALSLERLSRRYNLSNTEIEAKVLEFQDFINEIQAGNFNHMDEESHGDNRCSLVAIRSIDHFIALSHQFFTIREERTQFPLKKIIALVWKGVMDTSNHRPNGKNAKEHLIQGLCESQRRYNYGNTTGRDLPTCDGGAINDIVATLDDIHLDVMIVLINPTSISDSSLTFARKFFLDNFNIEMKKDTSFMARVDSEIATTEWQDQALSRLYDNCIQETATAVQQDIEEKMQRAIFTPKLINDVNKQAKSWIQKSKGILRENKCMLEYAKRRYSEVHNLQQTNPAQKSIKDEFEKLLGPIQAAVSAFKSMQTNTRISSIFKTIDLAKIGELCQALEAKSYLDVIEWLCTEGNVAELKVGVLGRHLKQTFMAESGQDRPFGSPDLDSLSKWVEYCAIGHDISYLHCVS